MKYRTKLVLVAGIGKSSTYSSALDGPIFPWLLLTHPAKVLCYFATFAFSSLANSIGTKALGVVSTLMFGTFGWSRPGTVQAGYSPTSVVDEGTMMYVLPNPGVALSMRFHRFSTTNRLQWGSPNRGGNGGHPDRDKETGSRD